MRFFTCGVTIVAALACGGVTPRSGDPTPGNGAGGGSALTPVTSDGPVIYAAAVRTSEALPARFLAGLPNSTAALAAWDTTYPPRPVVEVDLCRGDAARWAQVGVAASEAAAEEQNEAAVLAAYGALVQWCEPTVCATARTIWTAGGVPAGIAATALANCEDVVDVFASPNALPAAVVAYWTRRSMLGDPIPAPVSRQLASLIAPLLKQGDAMSARLAAIKAGTLDDPDIARAIMAAAAGAPDESARAGVLMGLYGQSDPEGKAAFAMQCAKRHDGMCEGYSELAFAKVEPPPSVPPDGFSSFDDLDAALRTAGLIQGSAPSGVHPNDIVSTLQWYGSAAQFDTETDQFPNEHHRILTRLAALGGEALRGAAFDEVTPNETGEGPYELQAWMDGLRWSVTARNLGDWYDMPATLGLLNTLSRARGRAERWVLLPTGDQTSIVLCANENAIHAGMDAGLIAIGEGDAGMADGKAAEAAVLGNAAEN